MKEKKEKIDRISDYVNLDEDGNLDLGSLYFDPRQDDYVLEYDKNFIRKTAIECLKTYSSIALEQMTLDTKIVITVYATDPDTKTEIDEKVTFLVKDFFHNEKSFSEFIKQQERDQE